MYVTAVSHQHISGCSPTDPAALVPLLVHCSSNSPVTSLYYEAGWRQLLAGPTACRAVKAAAGDYLRSAAGFTWSLDGRTPGEYLAQVSRIALVYHGGVLRRGTGGLGGRAARDRQHGGAAAASTGQQARSAGVCEQQQCAGGSHIAHVHPWRLHTNHVTWAVSVHGKGIWLNMCDVLLCLQGLLVGGLMEVAGLGAGSGPLSLKKRLDASWATNLSPGLALTLNASAGRLLDHLLVAGLWW